MTPEEAYNKTYNKTDEVLECYFKYLQEKARQKHGDNFSLTYIKTPKFYDYDAEFYFNGKRVLNVEVKVRDDIELNKYPQTKIPLRKHGVALVYFNYREIKSIYLALFSDCLVALNLHEKPDNIRDMLARNDRGNDTDEYAMYDITRFTQIA